MIARIFSPWSNGFSSHGKYSQYIGDYVSPWGAGCGSIVVWPLHYLVKGQNKVVIGGWDPSARKFFKTDELSFTVPFQMFKDMLHRYDESFLTTKAWKIVQKKIARSNQVWA